MDRYTTPTLPIRIKGMNLSGCDVHVTFKDGSTKLVVKNPPMSGSGTSWLLSVRLTEEQTAMFDSRTVRVMANIFDRAGNRLDTTKAAVNIGENYEGVVSSE